MMSLFKAAMASSVAVLLMASVGGEMAFAQPTKLTERTPVKLRLLQSLTSGKAKQGESVSYEVREDVKGEGGVVLVLTGAKAVGKVTVSKRRGMFGKPGKLEFTVESVQAVDGSPIPIRASVENRGKSNGGTVLATALLLTVFTVFIQGKDTTVKEGTEVLAYVDRDIIIDPASSTALSASPPATATPAQAQVSTVAASTKFTITSSILAGTNVVGEVHNDGPIPAAAEVIVLITKDGKTVGGGTVTLERVEVNAKQTFSVPVTGSTDGILNVQVNPKDAPAVIPAPKVLTAGTAEASQAK